MDSDEKICICLICDQTYLPFASFLTNTLKEQNSAIENVYVLTIGVSQTEFTNEFKDLPAEQIIVDMKEIEAMGVEPQGHVSTATYAKIMIGDLLPSQFSRCLYLDIDVLPLRSIQPLLDFPLNRPIAATIFANGETRRLFGTDDATYFSAGLLLIDLDIWRKKNFGLELSNLLRENPKLFQGDNDLFNIFFRENWQPLPPSTNVMVEPILNSHLYDKGMSPMIIHFVGPRKPWTKKGRTKWHKLWRDLYYKYHPLGIEKARSDLFIYRIFLKIVRTSFIAPLKYLIPYKWKEAFLKFGEK